MEQGYFRVLFSLVERVLYHLEVDHLIVPASKEVQSLWKDKLGFVEMAEERVSTSSLCSGSAKKILMIHRFRLF